MRQIEEQFLDFIGLYAFPIKCQVRAFIENGAPAVVIVSELPGNRETSITAAAEIIATDLYEWLERPETGMVFIEHYPEGKQPERFFVVSFTEQDGQFTDPKWKHTTRADIETIIGQAL